MMSDVVLTSFHNKRILLLQGPVGPFFFRLRKDLERVCAKVVKVNFNGGDWLFYPRDSKQFRGALEEWPEYLAAVLEMSEIDVLVLFGDCRIYHRMAVKIAKERNIQIRVFEEGYFRPDHITFESNGVNGFSMLPRDPGHYRIHAAGKPDAAQPIGYTFWHAAMWAILYYLAAAILSPWFRNYRHHRPLRLSEGGCWIRALWRKLICRISERKIQEDLLGNKSKRFFLVPLQVHSDHQISVHSSYVSIEAFIREIVESFSVYAPDQVSLVIKHHPLDRGYRDYAKFIHQLRSEYRLGDRLVYVHDLHLPSLFRHAVGAVVVNSTVGLSALFHGTPVKVCGKAVYDIRGLTFQENLNRFWRSAQAFRVDHALYRFFRHYVISHTQINGSFYRKLSGSEYESGICWNKHSFPESALLSSESEIPGDFANSKIL